MLCPKCQHRNPDENRFCGNCGCDLTKSASTIYPREGYDEADLPPVSEAESTVPRFRRDVPPLPSSEYGPVSEHPANSHAETRSFQEIPLSDIPVREIDRTRDVPSTPARNVSIETRDPISSRVADRNEPPREATPREIVRERVPEPVHQDMSSYGTTGGILFNLDPRKSTPLVESKEPVAQVSEPVAPRRSEGIHGPSFLGLADSGDPDFLDEIDEPSSHSRRNWLLLALLILIALAALQWRNIRETGINFAGSMKLNLPGKKAAPAKPAETAATDTPSENGAANNGKPEIVVDPTNKSGDQAAQSNAQGSPVNGGANQPANPAPSPSASAGGAEQQGAAKVGNDNAAAPAAQTQQQPSQQAKNTPPGKAEESAADNSTDDTDAEESTPPAKSPAKSAKAKTPAPKPEPVSAGAEELARANTASSPETAAKWLWTSTSKGNLDAPVRLADMYATGRGVPKDCEQANVLLRSSARRGNPRASARLGMYYATGQCVQQDRAQAWHWLSVAHQRDPNSDWITQYRQRLWSEMTPDERARAGNGPTANASE